MHNSILVTALVCTLLIFSSVSLADSSITLSTESGDAQVQVKNGWVLMQSNEPGNTANIQNNNFSEAIFDTHSQTLYLIDHDAKTVSPLTRANIEQLGNTLNAANDVLDSMPADQRSSVSDFMRGLGIELPAADSATAVQLSPVSEQQFRGIQCQENSVIEDGQELGRICITQSNTTPLSNQDYQSLLSAQHFFLFMAKQAAPFAEQYGQAMPNLDGIALNGLVVYSNQHQASPDTPPASFVITAIDTRSVDPITLPAGYQSRPLMLAN